jgi:DNA-binding CsgD family transcriptional regulator
MEPETEQKLRLALFGAVALLALNGVINLFLDIYAKGHPLHIAIEVTTIIVGMLAAAGLGIAWLDARRGEAEARRAVVAGRAERDVWRDSAKKALEGLGQAIDRQFREWDLTPTERQVALLLLKGHSHKRVADLTGRRERTVRQHSVVVYQKAGISGRAGLAAFFLEDLILPDQEREAIQVGGAERSSTKQLEAPGEDGSAKPASEATKQPRTPG